MHSLRLPNLSLLSTKTKLLIHGVASCTGASTPACSILFISCWNFSFKCTGIGEQGVCLGGMLGSTWIWQSGPRNLPIPSKTSGYSHRIISLLVISLGTCVLAAGVWAATSCFVVWADTSCCCVCNTVFVSWVIYWVGDKACSWWEVIWSLPWLHQVK